MNVSDQPLPKVIWIEDGARYELREMLGTVYYERICSLKLAEDASQAADLLRNQQFDAMIIDVRLPPGASPEWRRLYQQSGQDKIVAQLGLRILEWVCKPNGNMHQKVPGFAQPIPIHRIGVFTIESYEDIKTHLNELGVKVFEQKTTATPDTIIVSMIHHLLANPPG